MKNKKSILLLILFIITIYFIMSYLSFFDRINLINNTILIESNISEEELDQFKLFFWGEDTIYYELSKKKKYFTTPDWYGKDHLILKKDSFELRIGFNDYKFSSWHKVSCVIFITKKEKEINVDWRLSTKWNSNRGSRQW